MPGSANNASLRQMFKMTPMPVSMEQLEKNCGPGNSVIAYHLVNARIKDGLLPDGNGYWMTDEVMAEGVSIAEEKIKEWQEYLDYLQRQRTALAARGLPK